MEDAYKIMSRWAWLNIIIFWLCTFSVCAEPAAFSQTIEGRVFLKPENDTTSVSLLYRFSALKEHFELISRMISEVSALSELPLSHSVGGAFQIKWRSFSAFLGEGIPRTSRTFYSSPGASLIDAGVPWSFSNQLEIGESLNTILMGFDSPYLRVFRCLAYSKEHSSVMLHSEPENATSTVEFSLPTSLGLVSISGSILSPKSQISGEALQYPLYWTSVYSHSNFKAVDVRIWAGLSRGYITPLGIAAALEMKFDTMKSKTQKEPPVQYFVQNYIFAANEWYTTYRSSFPGQDFYFKQYARVSFGEYLLYSTLSVWSVFSGSSLRRLFDPSVSIFTKYSWFWALDGADEKLAFAIPGWLLQSHFSWDKNGLKRIEPTIRREQSFWGGRLTLVFSLKADKATDNPESGDSDELLDFGPSGEGVFEISCSDVAGTFPHLPLAIQSAFIQIRYQRQIYASKESQLTASFFGAIKLPTLQERPLSPGIQIAGELRLNTHKTSTLVVKGTAAMTLESMASFSFSKTSVSMAYSWKSTS